MQYRPLLTLMTFSRLMEENARSAGVYSAETSSTHNTGDRSRKKFYPQFQTLKKITAKVFTYFSHKTKLFFGPHLVSSSM